MSGYDILDALIPFKGQKGTVGIVGFSSVIKGCARVAEQLNINYKILPYREMIKKRFLA
ncbi:Propionate catabolism operon regulatory protein PrpR [Salmonella enterica subsp. enterica serovar Heidelberg str. RI-11-014316]|nr:Propionate catabolism operon regulatory protein PrpR [Salmonella enterica subsp. enterica serovar Heidelberg str. RI-11-014316]